LYDAYTRGYTLAESYMMASFWGLSWMDAIMGDPKLAPYNRSYLPDLTLSPDDIVFSNPRPNPGETIDVDAAVHNVGHFPAVNATVSFYLGDPRLGGTLLASAVSTVNDGSSTMSSLRFDTSGLNGWYDICVFADSPDEFYELDETNNIACSKVGVVTTYTIHLTPGHRFMSFPLVPANESIESVLSSVAGCFDYVRYFDAADPISPWNVFMPGRSSNSLLRLGNGMGFWINVTAACDLTVIGVRPNMTTIPLHAGWNMVGFPSMNASYAVADLKAALGMPSVSVEAFDATAAPYYLRRVPDSYTMMAGEGYWVFVPSAVSWIVPG
jgi:hypothetical protein